MSTPADRIWRRYLIHHHTEYCYAYSVSSAHHRAHLTPIDQADQRVVDTVFTVNHPLAAQMTGTDFFGNSYRDFAIQTPHRLLTVSVALTVDVRMPTWPKASIAWTGRGLARRNFEPGDQAGTEFAMSCAPYLTESPMIPLLAEAGEWARAQMPGVGQPLHEQLLALTRAIHETFVFDPEATAVGTPLLEVLQHRRGVCQDFAQIMIAGLRSIGIPARYVSGYILTNPPPGQSRLIGADATHAWVEAWCPGHGWLGLDPTNGKAVTDEFVKLAVGRDYADVIPLRGVVMGGGTHALEVSVTMMPEDELDLVVAVSDQDNIKCWQALDTAAERVAPHDRGDATGRAGKNQIAGRERKEVR
jgi:transglutaminase-like putative cysteine protease